MSCRFCFLFFCHFCLGLLFRFGIFVSPLPVLSFFILISFLVLSSFLDFFFFYLFRFVLFCFDIFVLFCFLGLFCLFRFSCFVFCLVFYDLFYISRLVLPCALFFWFVVFLGGGAFWLGFDFFALRYVPTFSLLFSLFRFFLLPF